MIRSHTASRSSFRGPARLLVALLLIGCGSDPMPPEAGTSVTVSVTTTGDSPDVNGYTVTVGTDEATVAATGSTELDVSPGAYDVVLGDVAANCSVTGDAVRSVTVVEGEGASVSFEVTCTFDAAGIALEQLSCPDLAPAAVEGVPFERVALGNVPAAIERPLLARVSWSGAPNVSMALTWDDGGAVEFMVPLHPGGSLDGGDVTVRLSDEAEACPGFAFTILPLPTATGELEAIVDVADTLLQEQATLFGTTTTALLTTPLAAQEPGLVPLAIAAAVLAGSASDGSLRSIVDGADPDFGADELDFAERVLARTGLRADLEAELARIRAAAPSAFTAGPAPARAPLSPGLALDCLLSHDTMDADLLDQCMTLGRDKIQGTASQETQENAIFAMDAASMLGSRLIARPIASLIEFSQLYDEAVAKNLPTEFTSIDVTPAPAFFLEDQPGPGTWLPAEVTAVSAGWSLEALLAEIIQRGVTPDVRPSTRRLSTGERQVMLWVGGPVGDALMVEDFFQGLVEQLIEILVEFSVDVDADLLTIPPITYGPVDISHTDYSDSRIVTGTSVELTGHDAYDPKEPGISYLEIITAVGRFGGTSIETEDLPIEVGQLSVSITPDTVFMAPGQDTVFTVTVQDAVHLDSIERIVPTQGVSTLTLGQGGVHTLAYTAPQVPIPNSTVSVAVRHSASTGARGGNAPEEVAAALVRFAGVRLIPVAECVALEETIQLEVQVSGFDQPPTLVWQAALGEVDSSGMYTAPDQPGTETITVSVEGSGALFDVIDFPVGGCTCRMSMTMDGNDVDLTYLVFNLTPDLSAVESFTGVTDAPASVGLSFASAFGTATPAAIGYTGPVSAVGSGSVSGFVFINPEDPDDPVVAPVTVNLTENTGGVLSGTVFGSVRVLANPEPYTAPLSIEFYIEADPIFSRPDKGICEVVGS